MERPSTLTTGHTRHGVKEHVIQVGLKATSYCGLAITHNLREIALENYLADMAADCARCNNEVHRRFGGRA